MPLALGAALVSAEDLEVDATIQDVDADDRSLTVELEETGKMQTFRVDEETEISFTRRPGAAGVVTRSGFDDLRAGQEVTLRFDDEVMDEEWVLLRIISVS
jgi:hypothetical protein